MQVKKFVGADMKEALAKVKRELGPDAVIFATRQIRPRSLIGPTRLEVSAAASAGDLAVDDSPALPRLSSAGPVGSEPVTPAPPTASETRMGALRNELRGLREELRGSDIDEGREALVGQLEELRKLLSAYSLRTICASDDWFVNVLENADVELGLADEIGGIARRKFSSKAADVEQVAAEGTALQAEALVEAVAERLRRQTYKADRKRNVIAVVGPTGVGKSTTIAKIAANASLLKKKTVGIITTDVFRVGSIEQMQQYAALIGIPMEAVTDAAGFRMAMSRFEKYDLVLIDTAGRNPDDHQEVSRMIDLLDGYGVSVHLAIEAATRHFEIRDIVERFEPMRPDAIIVTKYDEASILGGVVNGVGLSKAPISYLTFGQRVPEDITRPDLKAVAKQLVEKVLEGAGEEWRGVVLAEADAQARSGLTRIQRWSETN